MPYAFVRGRAFRDIVLVLVLVFGVGSFAMLLARVSPLVAFGALFDGAFGTREEVAETLVQATNLLFPALGIAVAFRAGLFNIGAEGQLILGGFAAGWLGAQLPLPWFLAIPMVLIAGALAGGVWGAIPGFLRARFGANEVIATLMLNVVAVLLATYLVNGPLALPGSGASETPSLPHAAQLPDLVSDSRLTWAFPIALVVAFVLRWVLQRTVFGYELRAAGDAPEAAKRAGIDLGRTAFVAMALSGAIAGLGGATIVAGELHRFNTGLSPGYGFIAIAVALVGNLDPLWIIVASLAFGVLQSGGIAMQAEAGVPRDVVALVTGLVIIALAGRRVVAARRST
ncbi:MAG: putative transport protein superfamily, rane [Candidatus Eremiobacteraeota bacterium]|jgi:general nucleoside transport system permease protein|nr:putative transport protein superfamily, rane [Candidatus Eremiobacteraeota bacterium]